MGKTLPVDCPNCGERWVDIDIADLEGLHSGCCAKCPICRGAIVFGVFTDKEYEDVRLAWTGDIPLRPRVQPTGFIFRSQRRRRHWWQW